MCEVLTIDESEERYPTLGADGRSMGFTHLGAAAMHTEDGRVVGAWWCWRPLLIEGLVALAPTLSGAEDATKWLPYGASINALQVSHRRIRLADRERSSTSVSCIGAAAKVSPVEEQALHRRREVGYTSAVKAESSRHRGQRSGRQCRASPLRGGSNLPPGVDALEALGRMGPVQEANAQILQIVGLGGSIDRWRDGGASHSLQALDDERDELTVVGVIETRHE